MITIAFITSLLINIYAFLRIRRLKDREYAELADGTCYRID